ncbi:MAG: YggS family pyridoxal phosphate-dependent enzyme [Crocinitomicaceae bacterium]|nr:YggS family pyridoxal phosphate-dependent enzyme [Crocinitomicaceae bacterium]
MISSKIQSIKQNIGENITLVAVSKTKPIEMIVEAMQKGHLDFGENKVQELVEKHEKLPKEIKWHMIGHLQRNKVKYIAPFVHLIHGADSERLINEINKQGEKNNRIIDCLLQFHIAQETTKFGFNMEEVNELIKSNKFKEWGNVNIRGVMGMATFTNDKSQVKTEFESLKLYFDDISKQINSESFNIISMGMSGDYKIAIECGSNMLRIGSTIFGAR